VVRSIHDYQSNLVWKVEVILLWNDFCRS